MEPENINKDIWQKILDKFTFLNPKAEKLKKEVVEYNNIRNFYKTYRGIVSICFIILFLFFLKESAKELVNDINNDSLLFLAKTTFVLIISIFIAIGKTWAMKILVVCILIFQIQIFLFLRNDIPKEYFPPALVAAIQLSLIIIFFIVMLFKAIKVEYERNEYIKNKNLWIEKINKIIDIKLKKTKESFDNNNLQSEQQTIDNSKKLYNPKTWGFISFFVGFLPVSIFAYHNSKIINKSNKNVNFYILIGIVLDIILYTTLIIATYLMKSDMNNYAKCTKMISSCYERKESIIDYLLLFLLILLKVVLPILTIKFSKQFIPYYEQIKKEYNLKGGKDGTIIIIIFFVLYAILLNLI